MLILYSAEVCPFAQRTRALLNRLDVEFELREIDLHDKPEDFLEISPTGKVPLLRTDECVLYESQVINDYLADRYQWQDAYASDRQLEYRQKLAMKQWDATLLGPFYEGLSDQSVLEEAEEDIRAELSVMDQLVADMDGAVDNLFSFHVATFWARMEWLSDYSAFPNWVRDYDQLHDWLESAVEQTPIQKTLPEKEPTVQSYVDNYVNAE